MLRQVWTWFFPSNSISPYSNPVRQYSRIATKSCFMQNYCKFRCLLVFSTAPINIPGISTKFAHFCKPSDVSLNCIYSGYFAQGELQFIIQFATWETWLLDFAICTACDNHWLFQPFPQGLKVGDISQKMNLNWLLTKLSPPKADPYNPTCSIVCKLKIDMSMCACMNVSANYGSCVDLQGPGLSMNMGGARQSVTSAGYFLQQCFIFGQPKRPLWMWMNVGCKSQIGRCYC